MAAIAERVAPPRALPHPWTIVAVVMVGNFMGPLYSSVANVVLPNLVASFGSDIATMEWVVSGFMLGYAVAMPIAGWLADTYGRRRIYLAGLTLFTVASVCTAFAWSAESMIGFRILQAIGGGMVSPVSMALIMDVVPHRERGKALGIWGLGMMLAPSFGPWISGLIVDRLDDWRLIFLMGVPFGIAGLVAAALQIPHDEDRVDAARVPFDAWGFALLTVALVAFLVPLTQGERAGWDDPGIVGSFAVSAVAFPAFVLRELRARAPMMDLSLFADRTFAVAVALRAILGMGYYFAIFLLPLFTQGVLGWTPTLSGLVLMPAGVAMALLMPVSGALADRFGARTLVIAGVAAAALGTLLFARIDVDWDANRIAIDALVRTAALGIMFTPLTVVALSAVPRARAGSASGILNTVWQVGGSLGIAIGETYLTSRTAVRLSDLADGAVFARPGVAHAMQVLGSGARGLIAHRFAVAASVQAYGDTFLLAAIVMAAGVPAAFLLPRVRRARSG